ncbi:DUF84 family protein [Aquisalimonas asiatica]|uniref:inosine/xanthosine triphosphatase n=1 Tax=Aquisalimonas asiatica TaxID=406100 RepID=A0A1H8V8M7_9GAMM|nr:DUF84 family protein [Aquisalimonas asiatica]SEP11739.1 inosine/xanthosine triphosphatase [Aquisalimonas asiatica]
MSYRTLYLGSTNPAKLDAVQAVFTPDQGFTVVARSAPSGVADQPRSDDETRTGAVNRAHWLVRQPGVELGLGLEGGLVDHAGDMWLCNWGALATSRGHLLVASGARIPLPRELAQSLRKGGELGDVVDSWSGREGVRHREGAIGILTEGEVSRADLLGHIVRLLFGQWRYLGESRVS